MRAVIRAALRAVCCAAALSGVGIAQQSQPSRRVFVGAELGSLLPAGVDVDYVTASPSGRNNWGAELRLEPSSYLQSYSVAGSWYPRGGRWLVGLRGRRMQLHPSWSRGYDPVVDNQWAASLETGWRWLPFEGRGTVVLSAGATAVSHRTVDLPMLFNVNLGVGWLVWHK